MGRLREGQLKLSDAFLLLRVVGDLLFLTSLLMTLRLKDVVKLEEVFIKEAVSQ